MNHLGLVDVVTLVLVASSVLGALLGRRGIVGALLSGAGTALFCWLVAACLVAWAPGVVAHAASSSTLLGLVPVPEPALEQVRAVGRWIGGQVTSRV